MNHFVKHLHQEISRHLFDYLLLVTSGIAVLLALKLYPGERLIEFIILASFISFYIVWGIYHHISKNDLHLRIVIEYIFIGFIALFLLKIIILPF